MAAHNTWLAAASFAVVIGTANASYAQAVLRWRLEPGQSLRYRLSHHNTSRIDVDGRAIEQDDTVVFDLTWRVGRLNDDGSMPVMQTVDRVRVDLGSGDDASRYDSESNDAEGELAAALREAYIRVVRVPVELALRPDGTIELADATRTGGRSQGGNSNQAVDAGSVLSPLGVKRLLEQSLPRLPDGPRAVGYKWTTDYDTINGPPLRLAWTVRSTLASLENGVAAIDAEIDTSVDPSRGVAIEVAIDSQSGRAHFEFDLTAGELVRSRGESSLKMTFSSGERSVSQSVNIWTSFERIAGDP